MKRKVGGNQEEVERKGKEKKGRALGADEEERESRKKMRLG